MKRKTALTVAELRRIKTCRAAKTHVAPPKSSAARPSTPPVRYVQWREPQGKYTLVKRGARTFDGDAALTAAYKHGTLDWQRDFWEFHHCDPLVVRNKIEPRHVAVFRMSCGKYVQPQAKHYKQAYATCKDRTQWCCLYAIRVENEQASKRRYQQRRKKVKN